jgi:hypothetical protein
MGRGEGPRLFRPSAGTKQTGGGETILTIER